VIVRQSFSATGFTDVARRLLNTRELDDSADRADNIAVTMFIVEREGRKEREDFFVLGSKTLTTAIRDDLVF
jgi:hypothetical protein